MERLDGILYKDLDELYKILSEDDNFKYNISEGAFYTNDGVFIGIDRCPYFGCLYSISDSSEHNINKWKEYILELWSTKKR